MLIYFLFFCPHENAKHEVFPAPELWGLGVIVKWIFLGFWQLENILNLYVEQKVFV